MDASILTILQGLVKYVEGNPLIATLMSGGAVVWLFANLRSIFSAIVEIVKAFISFTITNTYEDSRGYGYGYNIKLKQLVFNNFLIGTKPIWERTVNVDLSNAIDVNNFDKDTNATNVYESTFASVPSNDGTGRMMSSAKMVNAYGFSIRLIFGKICFVNRSYKLDGQRVTLNTSIRVFFARKEKFMKKLEDTINEKVLENIQSNSASSYVMVWNSETFAGRKMKRSLDSIFTKDNAHIELYNSIKSFIDNKDIYKKLNYPYNYCGLLYGVPGSGKTSTILAIASELKRDVNYINLSQTNSIQLLKAFNDNPNGSIYVFEDIDAISYKGASTRNSTTSKDDEKESGIESMSGISLSDLLNITDGLLASDGTICLFTTNHIDKLDPAFLRAGRMNKCIEFTYMESDVAKKMVETYLGVSLDNMIDNIKPAELQELILDVLLEKKTIDDLKSKFCWSAYLEK